MKRCIQSGQRPGMTPHFLRIGSQCRAIASNGGMIASIPRLSAWTRIPSVSRPLSAKSLSAANPSIRASARVQSAVAPCVTKALTGMPCASAARCDFVLSPPCVAHVPIASSRGRRLWVNPASIISHNDRRGVRFVNRNFRRPLPHAIIAPTGEASAGAVPAPGAGSGSRHGAPARITRKTALIKRRWTAMDMCFSLAVKDKRAMP